MPYPQVACSRTRRTKNNTPLIEWAKVWRGGGVELCLLCWFRIVRNSGQALSRILAFAVVWVGASLRRLCATAIVHPCTTRTVRVRPPAPKKAGLYLFVVVKVGRGCRIAVVWVGASLRRLCATAIVHPCTTRKLRVLPPAAPKIIPRLLSGVLFLVPMAGVEPARYCYQRILSPSRLPIPSHRLIKMCCKTALHNGNSDFTV